MAFSLLSDLFFIQYMNMKIHKPLLFILFVMFTAFLLQAEELSADLKASSSDKETVGQQPTDSPSVPKRTAQEKDFPIGLNGKEIPSLDEKLTLADCIEIALANSPKAVNSQLDLENAQVNVRLAQSQLLPTLSASGSQGYTNQKLSGSSRTDHGSSRASLDANLSISGVTDIVRNIKSQKLMAEQAEFALQEVKNEIVRTVSKSYYSLVSAKRAVEIRTQSRDLYKDQFERAQAFFEQGIRPKVDVTTAEVNLNNEELRLIRAKNLVKTASANLANSMGITTPKILDVAEISDFEKIQITFNEAVDLAYANRPDVLSIRTDEAISQIKLNQAKAAYWPTFSFSAGFSKYDGDLSLDNEETKLLAAVEIPLFSAFKTYNGVKQAKLSLEKTRNSSRSLLNNVFLEVQSAYIKMQEAAESIPIAELNVEKAKENLDLSRGRYNEGIGDIIELKDAEVAYTDAELSLLTARYDYASAVADLKQAMGTK